MGQVGLEWSIAGFGDFSGNANETDMLMRNNNTGTFEIYDVRNNTITFGTEPYRPSWSRMAGCRASVRSVAAGSSDMLMRNTNTGALELYDISSNHDHSGGFGSARSDLEWTVSRHRPNHGVVRREWSAVGQFAARNGCRSAKPLDPH